MANYAVLVHHERWSDRVATSLRTRTAAQQVRRVSIAPGWSLTWVAAGGAKDLLPEHRTIFAGYAVDQSSRSVVFGADGYSAHPLSGPAPGCYVLVRWDDDAVSVTNDLFGCLPMYSTGAQGLLMASDSPSVLLALRRELGLEVTPDVSTLATAELRNVLTAQPVGHRTMANEISYAALGSRATMSLTSGGPRLITGNLPQLFPCPTGTYPEILREVAVDIASLMRAISSWQVGGLRLNLSGGTDSRICLAAALTSSTTRSSAIFNVARRGSWNDRDSEVVEALSAEHGFPLGSRHEPPAMRRHPDALRLWSTDAALSYYPLVMQPYGIKEGAFFTVTGHGGETFRGNYGLRSMAEVVRSAARQHPAAAAAIQEISFAYLESAGVSPTEPLSAEWHFLAIRNALHASRSVPMTKFSLRPLQDPRLVPMNKVPAARRPRGMAEPASIGPDLITLLTPRLALQPYDRADKGQDLRTTHERLRILGGPVLASDLEDYRAVGDPSRVTHGPSASLEEIVGQDVPQGGMGVEQVRTAFASAITLLAGDERIPTGFSAAIDRGRVVIGGDSPRVAHPSGDIGKVLSASFVLSR